MRMTAADCKALGVVDEVIPEPPGGAHSDPLATIDAVGRAPRPPPRPALARSRSTTLLDARYGSSGAMGAWEETAPRGDAGRSAAAAVRAAPPAGRRRPAEPPRPRARDPGRGGARPRGPRASRDPASAAGLPRARARAPPRPVRDGRAARGRRAARRDGAARRPRRRLRRLRLRRRRRARDPDDRPDAARRRRESLHPAPARATATASSPTRCAARPRRARSRRGSSRSTAGSRPSTRSPRRVARGVYVVITDHHLPPEELPEGAVLVDPKIPGCPYPFKELCGAGLAWKLAEALLRAAGAAAGLSAARAGPGWRRSRRSRPSRRSPTSSR